MSDSATLWIAHHQALLSMKFFWQEYWSGLPFPPPEDRPNPGIELTSSASPALQVDSFPLSQWGRPLPNLAQILWSVIINTLLHAPRLLSFSRFVVLSSLLKSEYFARKKGDIDLTSMRLSKSPVDLSLSWKYLHKLMIKLIFETPTCTHFPALSTKKGYKWWPHNSSKHP